MNAQLTALALSHPSLATSRPRRALVGRLGAWAGALALGLGAAGMTGCNNAGEGAISGAVLGAGAGAIIGSLTGSAGRGAIIGGAAGAIGGGVLGDQNARNARNSSR